MAIFWFCVWLLIGSTASSCPENSLVEYELRFETHWDRRDFPKHYPEWRPPASWSKLVGYSHNSSFLLFRKGKLASLPFQHFVASGNSDRLDLQTQGSAGIQDAFYSTPITTGVGKSLVRFTVNGNRSMISLASKITPSPDWFVGLDSFDLCSSGRWREYIHLQTEPMDAGIDNGLTFTSPNWQTDPQEPIRQITNHHPPHPAGSFYYPELDDLPTIAHFTIAKLHEYSLQEKFDAADLSLNLYNTIDLTLNQDKVSTQKPAEDPVEIRKEIVDKNKNQVIYSSSENDLPIEEQAVFNRKIVEEASWETNEINRNQIERKPNKPKSNRITNLDEPSLTLPIDTTSAPPENAHLITSAAPVTPSFNSTDLDKRHRRYRPRKRLRNVKHKKNIPTGDAMAVIDNIVRKYQKEHRRQLRKRRRDGRLRGKSHHKKIRPPRDCRVSDWSEWSECSKTCGIGEKVRTREMTKRARRGGKPCPSLQETTWCGSARACQRDYFNWSF